MTILLMMTFAIAGILGYCLLPINSLPKMDFPTINVSASMPGADAQTMSKTVALPLERRFSSIAGIDSMNSVSSQGSTKITLQFNLDRDIDSAAQDVNSAISSAMKELPKDMSTPPTYKKINPSEQPIMFLSISSKILGLSEVDMYANNFIANRISMISGVAQVDVNGSKKYAVRIDANPHILAIRGLTLDNLASAISASNISAPTGKLSGNFQSEVINPDSELTKAKDFEKIIIAEKNGIPIRVGDVAQVVESVESNKSAAWYNKSKSITLSIYRQPGSNSVEVVDSILSLLPQLRKQLPSDLDINIVSDRTSSVRESMHDVKYTFLLTMFLVVAVIFYFLNKNVRATIIPSLTLPIAIVGTFAFMYYLGYSLNNMTLLALTLAIGYVVDDAIVVLENISHHVENGENPLDAALKGSQEISFTVISMTVSLIAVFIPILFMQGVIGRLFHEFAMTITIVIMISGLVSLSLTPMMSRFLLVKSDKEPSFSYFQYYYEKLENFYKTSLEWVMLRQKQTLYFFVALFGFNIVLFMQINKGFFPVEDTGLIFGTFEAPTETSFDSMTRISEKLFDVIAKDEDVERFTASIGGGLSNTGKVFITLKTARKKGIVAKIRELRKSLGNISDAQVFLRPVANLRLGGLSSKSEYQYTLQGSDIDQLYKYTQDFEKALSKTPGFLDVTTDLRLDLLETQVIINRERAAKMGVSILEITNIINTAFGQRQVSTIFANNDAYKVILGLPDSASKTADDLASLFVRSKTGELIRLDTLAKFERGNSPLTVNHFNEIPATTISFNLSKKQTLGGAVEGIEKLEKSMNKPDSIMTSFQGQAQVFKSLQTGQIWLIIAAIVTIYIILGMLYESFIHPITILSSLPTAGIGALLALMLANMPLDVIGLIGLIMLIGIVKKNAIMMIDFAVVAQRDFQMSPARAIVEAAQRRFRPIMMTTCAAIIGVLPITFGLGAGAELRQPLGVAVAGGLLVSQILTLYITPVIYVYLSRFEKP